MTAPVNTAELLRSHLDEQERVGWHLDWPEALAALHAVVGMHTPKIAEEGDHYCPTCLGVDGDYLENPCPTLHALVQELLLRPYATWLRTRIVTPPEVTEVSVRRLARQWADVDWRLTDVEVLAVLTLVRAVKA